MCVCVCVWGGGGVCVCVGVGVVGGRGCVSVCVGGGDTQRRCSFRPCESIHIGLVVIHIHITTPYCLLRPCGGYRRRITKLR